MIRVRARKALENDEFVLHYQPIVCLSTGRTLALEALVRWEKPEYGMVSPAEFIPVAEETGLIVPLGEWVLRKASRQLAEWGENGFEGFRVCVNVSAAQFDESSFRDVVASALDAAGIDARRLELELTETMLMQDARATQAVLADLKALGVLLAIDDFGTGYSSLAYLKRFPIDALKIDQSFIRDIATDPDDAAIVDATIGLARSLRLGVVAEGVADRTQLDFLVSRNCDSCQGFLLARPMPADQVEHWLAQGPWKIEAKKEEEVAFERIN